MSRGRESGEKLSDSIFSLGVNATRPFSLNANTRLVLTRARKRREVPPLRGPGPVLRRRPGRAAVPPSGAFDAMTFGFVGRALYEQYESSLRTGPRYFAGVNVRRSLTDRIDLFAEAGGNARYGRSDVFNWRDWSVEGELRLVARPQRPRVRDRRVPPRRHRFLGPRVPREPRRSPMSSSPTTPSRARTSSPTSSTRRP